MTPIDKEKKNSHNGVTSNEPASDPMRFPPGTFTPNPDPSGPVRMVWAQYALELKLLLRHGEQLLLTMFIPITLLVGAALLPFGEFGDGPAQRATTLIPLIMALAVIATAFTGQAIAVAFDRRYGALKRLAATALPVWGIVAGKSGAVVSVVFLQALLIGVVGIVLGWQPQPAGLLTGAPVIAAGTAAFAALGLLLGGSMRAEIVLAVANLMWFVFGGLAALIVQDESVRGESMPAAALWVARLSPSGALTEGLAQALRLSVDGPALAVLISWGVIAAAGAVRWFRFS